MNDTGLAFTVRPASIRDAVGAVAALRNSITELCFEDHQNDAATLANWLRNKTVEQFERWRLEPTNFLAVGDDGAVICGVGLIDQSGRVRLCYVRADRQRLGVGRALLTALEAQASSWGLSEIRVTSSATARRFYEKQGYASDGEPVQAFGVARGYPYRKRLLEAAA